jgi:lipopolysaccharide/colanic/teichoic acid biosynthesis glycosyltransferase
VPYFSLRSVVRPGLTGWAQVRYGYASTLEEEIEKVRYDLYYVKHLSLWLDLRILFDTLKIIVLGRGSATRHSPLVNGTPAGVSGPAT